jgi:hypothetical protein
MSDQHHVTVDLLQNVRLGCPQSRSGEDSITLALLGIETPFTQPVNCHTTNWAVLAHTVTMYLYLTESHVTRSPSTCMQRHLSWRVPLQVGHTVYFHRAVFAKVWHAIIFQGVRGRKGLTKNYSLVGIIQNDQNKTEPNLGNTCKKQNHNTINQCLDTFRFYCVTKLKKTNISHLLTLDFKKFST